MIDWMKKTKYPFDFSTEASINLADDEELMKLMIQAGFKSVFVGIETPDNRALKECHKFQNTNRDLMDSVER
ncbi:MAG: B12-binding domain-containing radical SAM protein, partial [Desulfobacterales bacterium CG23_combo_of_CG06-09_8_20_14_all_52_9]